MRTWVAETPRGGDQLLTKRGEERVRFLELHTAPSIKASLSSIACSQKLPEHARPTVCMLTSALTALRRLPETNALLYSLDADAETSSKRNDRSNKSDGAPSCETERCVI